MRRGRSGTTSGALRRAFLAVYLACSTGLNAVVLIPRDAAGSTGDNTLFAASWILLHLGGLALVLTQRSGDRRPLLLALVLGGGIVVGAVWSVAPSATVVYGAMVAGNIVVAAAAAREMSLRDLLRLVLAVLVVLTAVGLALHAAGVAQVMDFDSHGRQNYLGGQRTRALFQHNITAGFHGAVGAALSATLLRGLRRIACLMLFIALVLIAGSAMGLVLLVLALLLVPSVRVLTARIAAAPLVLIAQPLVLAAAAALVVLWRPLMLALGRDPSMTGRTALWDWGIDVVRERPLLGWGFDAYFRSPHGDEPSEYVPRFDGYAIDHFHNAFLQSAVDFGLVGLLLVVLILFTALRRSYSHARHVDRDVGAAALVLVLLLIAGGFAEVLFPSANEFGTMLLSVLFFALPRAAAGATPRSSAPGARPVRAAHR